MRISDWSSDVCSSDLCVLALCGITAATLYQKRFCGSMDLRSGSVIQYTAAGLAAGLGSFLFEEQRIDWTGELIFALAWLVLLLSLGAVSQIGRASCRERVCQDG